jgi:D-aminopeptidase
MVRDAIDGETSSNSEEGNVGGGTGMTCYDWNGGIRTASRKNVWTYDSSSPAIVIGAKTGYTLGVLV